MANTTVRDSGNNVVSFLSFNTPSGYVAAVVNVDPTGNAISNANPSSITGNVSATQVGSWTVNLAANTVVNVANFPVTQAVSLLANTVVNVANFPSSQAVTLPSDQDPIYDHANAVRVTIPASNSSVLITPPAGCKYIRLNPEIDVFVNTANAVAGDTANCVKIYAGKPEVVPVVSNVTVNIFSVSSGVVRATPMKVR